MEIVFDTSSCNGFSCGAFVVDQGDVQVEQVVEAKSWQVGTAVEVLFLIQIIKRFSVTAQIKIFHDVCQLESMIKKKRWSCLNWMCRTYRNIELVYLPRRARSYDYLKCHDASRDGARRLARLRDSRTVFIP